MDLKNFPSFDLSFLVVMLEVRSLKGQALRRRFMLYPSWLYFFQLLFRLVQFIGGIGLFGFRNFGIFIVFLHVGDGHV